MSMGTSIARPEIKRAEQISWNLLQKHGPERFAWVEHENKLFYAIVSAKDQWPLTPVTQLIQYLFDKYVDHSFFILRKRLFSTETLTPFCQSMVKVTAKRVTGDIKAEDHGIDLQSSLELVVDKNEGLIRSNHRSLEKFDLIKSIDLQSAPRILRDCLEKIPRGEILHDYNRAIVAILADQQGRIISAVGNNNYKNKTLHAEICLMQDYITQHEKPVPPGSIIYSSLKPCKMCSDAILRYCKSTQVQVYFLKDDPGPLAKQTSLEKTGKLQALS